MFKVGNKAYFNEDTLRRVREEDWQDQGRHWSPYGLTGGMAKRIMDYDYVIVDKAREHDEDGFGAMDYAWANSWFKPKEPKGLEGAVKLI